MKSKSIKILWIDDEPSRKPAFDELIREKGISKASNFISVKDANIQDILEKDPFDNLDVYDIILIDHRLGGATNTNLTGSSVAESIRDRIKNRPIVSITGMKRHEIDIHKQSAYDDVIEFNQLSNKIEFLMSLSDGFNILKNAPPSGVYDMLTLMKAPKDDHDRIKNILPFEIKSNMSDLGFASLFYKWMRFKFIERPGFLLDRLWTSTVIGIKESRFNVVEPLFKRAKYNGIFCKTSNDLWWQSQIKKILFNKLPERSEMLPWLLGHSLPELSESDIPKCHVCKENYPEIVAFTDETIKKAYPMHIRCTELHDNNESLLYFEDIRIMRKE